MSPSPVTPPAPPSNPSSHNHAARIAGAVRLTDVRSTDVPWLWPGRIPLGRITLLVSDPGVGKSLLALDIAARASSGTPWPDNSQPGAAGAEQGADRPNSSGASLHAPGSVLLLTAEDDLADTVRPRLEALGANCDRILAIQNIPGQTSKNDVPRNFALDRDMARLNHLLDTLPDCRLIIIDPISAYLGGANEQANAEVQNLLLPLATLARQRQIAVLIVSHLRKKAGAAVYRTMGSLAFVAIARSAWAILKDPQNPSRRYLLPIKTNVAGDSTGLAYTIGSAPSGEAPVICWSPEPINASAEELLAASRPAGRPDHERQYAVKWLAKMLAAGPQHTREIKRAADAHGISYGTLRRAFRELGVQAVRDGYFSHWLWKLNNQRAQNPGGEFCAPYQMPTETRDSNPHRPPVEDPSRLRRGPLEDAPGSDWLQALNDLMAPFNFPFPSPSIFPPNTPFINASDTIHLNPEP